MKQVTQQLSEEHQNILKLTNVLSKKVQQLRSERVLDQPFFRKALEFIKNYADHFHHAKEENILFKELSDPHTKMHCNPVSQMLYEHDQGREFVQMIEEGLAKKDVNKVIEGSEGYSALLQEHIFKEDNILYPMAEQALSAKVKQQIIERFKEVDHQFPSEQYLKWLKQISEK